jgi:hypothetical protein
MCAYVLGRLAPHALVAMPDLVGVVDRTEIRKGMDLWAATKAAYAIEALGRFGSAASMSLPRLAKIAREIEGCELFVRALSGLTERAIARAACSIEPPSEMRLPVRVDDSSRAEPAWFSEWTSFASPRNEDSMARAQIISVETIMDNAVCVELGAPRMYADWSSRAPDADSMRSALAVLARDETESLSAYPLDWNAAIAWSRQEPAESRPKRAFRGRALIRSADIGTIERIDLELHADHSKYQWRGGFSIPNPWRRSGK